MQELDNVTKKLLKLIDAKCFPKKPYLMYMIHEVGCARSKSAGMDSRDCTCDVEVMINPNPSKHLWYSLDYFIEMHERKEKTKITKAAPNTINKQRDSR